MCAFQLLVKLSKLMILTAVVLWGGRQKSRGTPSHLIFLCLMRLRARNKNSTMGPDLGLTRPCHLVVQHHKKNEEALGIHHSLELA